MAAAPQMRLDVDVPAGVAQACRSAMVAFDPGRRTRSASPGRALPDGTSSTATSGSAQGSRSSKLEIRGSSGTTA